jgi:hypothetical protein
MTDHSSSLDSVCVADAILVAVSEVIVVDCAGEFVAMLLQQCFLLQPNLCVLPVPAAFVRGRCLHAPLSHTKTRIRHLLNARNPSVLTHHS